MVAAVPFLVLGVAALAAAPVFASIALLPWIAPPESSGATRALYVGALSLLTWAAVASVDTRW